MKERKPLEKIMVEGFPGEYLYNYINDEYRPGKYKTANISSLYVGCKSIVSGKVEYVRVTETPHFLFASNALHGTPISSALGYTNYAHYISVNWHPCSEDDFTNLITSIKEKGYDNKNYPILVHKSLRRPWPLDRMDVIDGFHRLAVLAALGEKKITVFTMLRRSPLHSRILPNARS